MTVAQYAELGSATLGALGTIILFFGSYSIQPLEGAPFGSGTLTEYNNRIKAKNANRLLRQRIGLGFLCLSFTLQAVAVFL